MDQQQNHSTDTTSSEEIDLIELVKKLWDQRIFILKVAGIAAIVGLIVAFSIPKEFTTTVKMAPEGINTTKGGGMADLAALAGFDLGSSSNWEGINLTLYPDVIMSTPFMVELSQIPVQGMEMDSTLTFYDYIDTQISSPWWSYVFRFPLKVLGWITSIGKEEESEPSTINPYALSKKQSDVLQGIKSRISIAVDKKTGVITASATTQDPVVTATVADSMVNKLQEYIYKYRTEKAVRDLEFTQTLFDEAKQNYHEAQRKWAEAYDANRNIAKQSAQVDLTRLQNEQQLAFGVYNQMAQQLESAKIKVQEQTPCVTIIEPASIPVKKSNTSKLVILIGFIFLGGCIAIGKILLPDFLGKKSVATETSQAK